MKNHLLYIRQKAKNILPIKKLIIDFFAILLAVAFLLVFYDGGVAEILSILIAFLFANLIKRLFSIVYIIFEDKQKISEESFPYDQSTYLLNIKIGNKTTNIWYYPRLFHSDDTEYRFIDTEKVTYSLPDIIENNYFDILEAHIGSQVANMKMIRLDDFKVKRNNDKKIVSFFTSRTYFFYDLLTNRAMDYRFHGDMTVRKIFESDKFISDFNESKMSNHIGINAIVFQDECMLLTLRGKTATMSKNKVTSSIAMGFDSDAIRTLPQYSHEKNVTLNSMDEFIEIVRNKTVDFLNLDSLSAEQRKEFIDVNFLGFGQLVYTGGKPQFYFAVVVNTKNENTEFNNRLSEVDSNRELFRVKKLNLTNQNSYYLDLILDNGEKVTVQAEKSFFANLYHLMRSQPEKLPDWVKNISN